jgi:anti-anti-sigma regulatory factor
MKQETFLISKNRDDNGNTKIVIEGDIGIKNITQIKKTLASIDIRKGTVHLDIRNAGKVDITTAQVLVAFREKLMKDGCETIVSATLTEEIHGLFTKAGLSSIFN